jgi:hypothetical protein
VTEGLSAEPALDTVEDDEPEFEWTAVTNWPSESVILRKDIADILSVLALLEGAADDQLCSLFADLLRTALQARRQALALLILSHHRVEIPEPGEFRTPQERMSEQLRAARDAVHRRRADIVPPDQPFTDRYGPGRPGLQAMTDGGLGAGRLHSRLPRMPGNA